MRTLSMGSDGGVRHLVRMTAVDSRPPARKAWARAVAAASALAVLTACGSTAATRTGAQSSGPTGLTGEQPSQGLPAASGGMPGGGAGMDAASGAAVGGGAKG